LLGFWEALCVRGSWSRGCCEVARNLVLLGPPLLPHPTPQRSTGPSRRRTVDPRFAPHPSTPGTWAAILSTSTTQRCPSSVSRMAVRIRIRALVRLCGCTIVLLGCSCVCPPCGWRQGCSGFSGLFTTLRVQGCSGLFTTSGEPGYDRNAWIIRPHHPTLPYPTPQTRNAPAKRQSSSGSPPQGHGGLTTRKRRTWFAASCG
jgi:hypothetical protein